MILVSWTRTGSFGGENYGGDNTLCAEFDSIRASSDQKAGPLNVYDVGDHDVGVDDDGDDLQDAAWR